MPPGLYVESSKEATLTPLMETSKWPCTARPSRVFGVLRPPRIAGVEVNGTSGELEAVFWSCSSCSSCPPSQRTTLHLPVLSMTMSYRTPTPT
jgi:hypothetical protein